MRIGMLTQWYDPEPGPAALPGVLARGLAARGHEVQVVTGFPNYPTGVVADGYRLLPRLDEGSESLHVRRVALYPNHDSSSVRRFANYASFGLSATALGVSSLRDVDAVWVNCSPITVAWPMWAAQLRYRIPSVVHVLDLWPDTVLAGGFARGGWRGGVADTVLHAWCNRIYSSASSVAYISPGAGDVLEERGVPAAKLRYVPMWADEAIFKPSAFDMRADLGFGPDQKVMLYAGALGEAQGLQILLEACSIVEDEKFLCVIAGSGIAESGLRRQADALDATNVRFIGRVPSQDMTALLASADFCYIGLRSHALSSVTMPSKTQATLAAGRSFVLAAQGDVADVARESGAAFVAESLDARSIANAIERACMLGRAGLREIGLKGRDYYARTFSAAEGVGRTEQLLLEAAEGAS
jgi:glycosyltransferase involved in cell wall biosynthesis